ATPPPRVGASGGAGAAMSALPPIGGRVASAGSKGSPFAPVVRPEALADPTECTISEAATLIKTRKLKPSALIGAYLERIAQWDPDYYQSYNLVLADESAARAAELDGARYIGPLHGVAIGVKDNYYTAGILTTANS